MTTLNNHNVAIMQENDLAHSANNYGHNIKNLAEEIALLAQKNVKSILSSLPKRPENYGFDDCNSAELLAELIRGSVVYCFETNCWWVYNGTLWRKDQNSILVERVMSTCLKVLFDYTSEIKDFDLQERFRKHIKRLQRHSARKNLLADCRSVNPINISIFDSNPYKVNFMNGVYDLREDKFIPGHKASDYMTKICACDYEPVAEYKRFEQFILEICGDGREQMNDLEQQWEYDLAVIEKANFLQMVLGYCLFGKNPEERMFILYGPESRNGKGTLMNTIMKLLNTYGTSTSAEILAAKKNINSSAPSEDIARLAGARLISMSELDKNTQIRSGTFKSLTGNDPIAARFLHQNSFEFHPDFKMILSTNHKPTCNDPTIFKSNRIIIIPFNHHFAEAKRDTGLKEDFERPKVLSAVANWLIQGYRTYATGKFHYIPDEVKEATDVYYQESDQLECYMAECLQADPNGEVPLKNLHAHYQDWCIKNKYPRDTLKEFKDSMLTHAKISKKRPSGAPPNATQLQMVSGYTFSKQMIS